MFKRIFILIVFVFMISSACASEATIMEEKTYINYVAALQTLSDTTAIKVGLRDEGLREILAGVMKIKEGKIGEIINKFLSNTPHWTWIIKEGSLPKNVNGQTHITSEGVVTILDPDKLMHATNLSVARTIIHEMVHAYLALYFRYDFGNANADYPAILEAWNTSKDQDYDRIQHDEIERSFIDDIASALGKYAKTVGLNEIDEFVYTCLAWGGLNFQNSTQLSAATKKRIQNRILAEQLNEQVGTEKPAGIQLGNS